MHRIALPLICFLLLANAAWSALPAGTEPPVVGRIEIAAGKVIIKNDLHGKRKAAAGMTVAVGDQFKTKKDGRVVIRFLDDTRLHIGPKTKLTVTQYLFHEGSSSTEGLFDLIAGQVRLWTARSLGEGVLQVRTRNAVAGIRGTTLEVVYWDWLKFSMAATVSGEVLMQSLKADDAGHTIPAGTCGWVIGKKPSSAAMPIAKAPDYFHFIGDGEKAPPDFINPWPKSDMENLY